MAVSAVPAIEAPAAELTAEQRRSIEGVIESYLVNNPEVVERAIRALEAKRKEAEERAVMAALQTHRKDLFEAPASPVGGNANGDVTVVEFFDYRCGVCRRVHPIVGKLVATDPNIRRVYMEWPILGPDSVFAARAALAARNQGDQKYWSFHDALMGSAAPLDNRRVLFIAERVGLDRKRLEQEMDSPEISRIIARHYAIAEALNLNGTPSFIVGKTVLRGGRDLAGMRQLVAAARQAAKAKPAATR